MQPRAPCEADSFPRIRCVGNYLPRQIEAVDKQDAKPWRPQLTRSSLCLTTGGSGVTISVQQVLLVLATMGAGIGPAYAEIGSAVGSERTVCVGIYDQTGLSAGHIGWAQAEVSRIYRAAGLQIKWDQSVANTTDAQSIDMSSRDFRGGEKGPFPEHDPRSCLVVSIVRNMPTRALPGALGFALPFAQKGSNVVLFRERIETAARTANIPTYAALGYAIAHEIGHVLLASSQHSNAGLMQGCWNATVWKLASQGLLTFLPEQARQLRGQTATTSIAAMRSSR
jgi:hypothetical protein